MKSKKIAFFDTKAYDKKWFNLSNKHYNIKYIESKLDKETAMLATGCEVVCAFVNDDLGKEVMEILNSLNVKVVAMRCAGYNNVDLKTAEGKITVLRVPNYSPYAVSEHAIGLLLTLNRKIHKAYNRTRDFNFSLNGLTGMDLHGKTVGVIGTGKIGQIFIEICKGFGMKILAYDPYPLKDATFDYVELSYLFQNSDIISLHCPLTEQTNEILNKDAFRQMKKGIYIINTSRGKLIDSEALLEALNDETVAGAGLDVYEEETDYFFEDMSGEIIKDDVLSLLVSKPNVIITSHQAFLTNEALENIAKTTINNIDEYYQGKPLVNQVTI